MKRVWRLHEKIMTLDIKKILKNKIKIRPTDPLQNLLCNPKHTYIFFWPYPFLHQKGHLVALIIVYCGKLNTNKHFEKYLEM